MKRTPRCSDATHREEEMLQDSKPSELHRGPRLPKSLPLLCTNLLLELLKAVCLGGRLYFSVLWTVPQNSAKMEKKRKQRVVEKFSVSLLVFLVLWWEVWRRGWLVLQ